MKSRGNRIVIVYTVWFAFFVLLWLKLFGTMSLIHNGDGYNQNFVVMAYFGKYVRNILKNIMNGIFLFPQFDFSIGLGEGILSTLNCYGVGDPFMLISFFFPVAYTAYAYTTIFFAKMYVSGLAFIYYCCKKGFTEKGILLGAIVYVGSQYFICHGILYATTFLSVMITLPIICYGIEKSIRDVQEGKKKISYALIGGVVFQALSGFYSLYMELIIVGVYALVVIFFCGVNKIRIMQTIWQLFIQVVWGLGISAIVLIPSIVAFFTSARGGESEWIGLEKLFQLEANTYWNTFSSIIVPGGLQEVGLMLPVAAVALALIGIWKGKDIPHVKVSLLIFGILYFNMRIFSWIMGGFSTAIYYGRWTFIMFFLVAILVVAGFEHVQELSVRSKWIIVTVIGGYFVVFFLMQIYIYHASIESDAVRLIGSYVIGTVAIIIGEWIVEKWKSNRIKHCFYIACISIGVLANVKTVYFDQGAVWKLKNYQDVRDGIVNSDLQKYTVETGFGRVDVQGKVRNEGIYTGQYTANEYLSMINSNIVNFYKEYAMVAEMWGSVHHLIGLGGRSGLNDLLSVAYYNAPNESEKIIENTDKLPLGIGYQQYMTEAEAETLNAAEKNAYLLDRVILNHAIDGFETSMPDSRQQCVLIETDYDVEYENIEVNEQEIHVTKDSKMKIKVKNELQGELYFFAESFRLTEQNVVSVGHVYFDHVYCEFKAENAMYTHGVDETLICLGNVEAGDNIVEITFGESATYEIETMKMYVLDTMLQKEWNIQRSQNILQDLEVTSNHIQGKVDCQEAQILFMSIPYSKGWRAYIDGELCEIYRADYGFMAVAVPKGQHQIDFRYVTPGIQGGLIISVLCIISFIYALVYDKRKCRV